MRRSFGCGKKEGHRDCVLGGGKNKGAFWAAKKRKEKEERKQGGEPVASGEGAMEEKWPHDKFEELEAEREALKKGEAEKEVKKQARSKEEVTPYGDLGGR